MQIVRPIMSKGMTPEKGRNLDKYESGYDKIDFSCGEPSVGNRSHKPIHEGSTPSPAPNGTVAQKVDITCNEVAGSIPVSTSNGSAPGYTMTFFS